MKKSDLCGVCLERPKVGVVLCEVCGRSYDRTAFRDCTVIEAIAWAARRTRFFDRKRQRKKA